MKLIYLLIVVALGLPISANAQRNIEVTLQHFYEIASPGQTQPTGNSLTPMTDGMHILFDADNNYKVFLSYNIRNDAATLIDSVSATDTIHIIGPKVNLAQSGITIGQVATSPLIWPANAPFALIPDTSPSGLWAGSISKPVIVSDWCDSVWITSKIGDPNPVNETGRTSNNIACNEVILDGWMTSVNDVKIGGNGLIVYPNPSNGNIFLMFNFDTNSSGSITIADVTGKTVHTHQLSNIKGMQTIKLDVGGLPNGLYSLRLTTGSKIALEKIYINK
jgi:hypothetical protein